ncbi:hypothetical protein QYE76_063459 [Lolium multiflorum]|uniref:Uncharacterized protein n=1 Tax=Lolium multiflorum TaxID=4521 RepID=A0AAD8S5K0_LOLMU|nr:hypothetical protein QYE76_063459 [Lolium multiflorum]
MALNEQDGAANNGFPRRSLHAWEGHLLYQAGYPCPPDTRPPGGGWRLSAGGVPIPPPPPGHALDAAIEEVRLTLSDQERAESRHHPDNYTAWNSYFCGGSRSSPPTTARRLRLAQQRRGTPALVERAGPDARRRPRSHRGRQRARSDDAPAVEVQALAVPAAQRWPVGRPRPGHQQPGADGATAFR